MQFSSFSEFIQMGGYAFNVWSVYALFILFFFINLYFPLLRRRQIIRDQRRRLVLQRETRGELDSDDAVQAAVEDSPAGQGGES